MVINTGIILNIDCNISVDCNNVEIESVLKLVNKYMKFSKSGNRTGKYVGNVLSGICLGTIVEDIISKLLG